MPEGMELPENFDPSQFQGGKKPDGKEMPDDFDFSKFQGGEKPAGMEMPENFDPGQFQGAEMPEGMEFQEGMPMPENGQIPNFKGENGGARPGMGNWGKGMETKEVDIGSDHISVEIENGKESGSMANIVPGAFVTITMNSKGEVTYVLISSQTGFGGRMNMGKNS